MWDCGGHKNLIALYIIGFPIGGALGTAPPSGKENIHTGKWEEPTFKMAEKKESKIVHVSSIFNSINKHLFLILHVFIWCMNID